MELIKKVNLLLSGLFMLLAFGCGGDAPEPKSSIVPVPVKSMLSKVSWANSAVSASEAIVYFNDDYFLGSQFGSNRIRVKYDDKLQRILQRSVCNLSEALLHLSLLKYDAQGQLTKITRIGQNPRSQGVVLDTLGYSIYKYDAEKRLSTINTRLNYSGNYYNPLNGVDSVFYLPNKVIRYKKYFFTSGTTGATLNKTIDYSFDNHKSAYAFPRWLYYYDITEGDMLPTDHNIASIKTIDHIQGTTVTSTFTYEYNSYDYPITWAQYSSLQNGVVSSGWYQYDYL